MKIARTAETENFTFEVFPIPKASSRFFQLFQHVSNRVNFRHSLQVYWIRLAYLHRMMISVLI